MGLPQAVGLARIGVGDRLAARRDTGVADQDVEAAEVAEGALDHPRALLPLADVGRVGLRAAPELLDLRDGRARGVLVAAVVDGDVGAVGGESERDGAADPAAAAAHQGGASSEAHGLLPFSGP